MSFLAQNLLFLRKNKGLTQAEMPARIDVSRATWFNYENGVTEPDIARLIVISELFAVKIDDLIKIDLSKNVHLIGNEATGKSAKNVYLNVLPNVQTDNLETENQDKGAGESELLKAVLKQLNDLTNQVNELKQKPQ